MKRILARFQSASLREALIEARNRVSEKEVGELVTENLEELFRENRNDFGPERTFLIQLLAAYFSTSRGITSMEGLLEHLNACEPPQTKNGQHAFGILCNNFIAQYSGGSAYGSGNAGVAPQIVAKLDEENLRLLSGNEDLSISPQSFGAVLDAITAANSSQELQLSRHMLQAIRKALEGILKQEFYHKELGIPMAQQPDKDDGLDVAELDQIAGRINGNETKPEWKDSYKYLDDGDVKELKREAERIAASIHNEIQISEPDADQIAWILQALDQYLSISPSPWKNKSVCDELYAALMYCLHYQFLHQPKIRARFRFFFGHQIPKVRVTLLKIVGQLGENCPCAWDMARLFGALQLLAMGYLGDGEAPGAKEVCTMGMHWHCERCAENVKFLRQL